jgi:hypothetical protein
VATAYNDVIEFISPERGARKLQDFQQLEYVPEDATGLVRCESGKPARVVVVSVGCE